MSVVRALCSQDERLVDEIKEIKIGKGVRQSAAQHMSINYSCDLITIDGFRDELRKNLFDQVISKVRVPWRNFEESRKFVHSLGLKNASDWKKYCDSLEKLDDIPADPRGVYQGKGWVSMGDWLGTGTIAMQNKIFRPFEECREFARFLGLKNKTDWRVYCQSGEKPLDITSNVDATYKNKGWVSWGDFLGTGNVAPFNMKFRSFAEAREFVCNLQLKNLAERNEYCASGNKPSDIPANPHGVYKNKGWVSWGHWIGTGSIAPFNRIYRSFESAREFVQSLNLKTP